MKKYQLMMFAIVLLTAGYLLFYNDNKSTSVNTQTGNLVQENKPVIKSSNEASLANPASSTDNSLLNTQHLSSSAPVESVKIPYEEDWCIKGVDLSEEDYSFAQQELSDWAEYTGEIWQNRVSFDGSYLENRNAELLEPYKEMNKADLLKLVEHEDRYAMITALQRQDIEWDLKDKIASQLLVFGTTSMSLMRLIHKEMALARTRFKKTQEVTPYIKQRLINSLSYMYYGMSQYDVSSLFHYVTLIDGDDIYGEALLPNRVLNIKDMEEIKANVQKITNQVNQKRNERNLPPLSEVERPKVVHHEFRERVAFLYANYGKTMSSVQRLEVNIGPDIKKSDCVKNTLRLSGRRKQ